MDRTQKRAIRLFYAAALSEVSHTFTVFFASPAYRAADISQGWYGALNISVNVTGIAGSLLSAGMARRGTGRGVATCWLLALACAAGLRITQNAAALVLLLPLLEFAAQGYLPCEQNLKNLRTGGVGRAVALSAYNMVGGIIGISIGPLLGSGTAAGLRNGCWGRRYGDGRYGCAGGMAKNEKTAKDGGSANKLFPVG